MDTEATRALIRRFVDPRANNDAVDDRRAADRRRRVVRTGQRQDGTVHRSRGGGEGAHRWCRRLHPRRVHDRRDVRAVIVDGERAVVQQRLTATALNGNDYANEYCWVYTCRDGKVQILEEYADTLHAGRVFGWLTD